MSGWPPSNAFPAQIYVNGTSCALNWAVNTVGGPGQTNGSAPYQSSDGSISITLSWNWNTGNGQVSWTWSDGTGDTGAWDGVSTFSNVPSGMLISLNPPPANPSYGPYALAWNGTSLAFNGGASQLLNADVYSGTYNGNPIWVAIDSAGNATVYVGGLSSPSFTGTYNSSSQLFDFGNANIGTLAAVNSSNNILGTSSGSGNLAIPGNMLSLGSWQNSAGNSVNGFLLAFTPSAGSGGAALLQFGSTVATTDWLWTRSAIDASTAQQTAMELDPANRLLFYAPGGDTAAKIVLDPAVGASFQVPVRVNAAGDIDMQGFTTGPQPGP